MWWGRKNGERVSRHARRTQRHQAACLRFRGARSFLRVQAFFSFFSEFPRTGPLQASSHTNSKRGVQCVQVRGVGAGIHSKRAHRVATHLCDANSASSLVTTVCSRGGGKEILRGEKISRFAGAEKKKALFRPTHARWRASGKRAHEAARAPGGPETCSGARARQRGLNISDVRDGCLHVAGGDSPQPAPRCEASSRAATFSAAARREARPTLAHL